MRVAKYGALLAVLTLSFSLGLFAKDKNEAKFTLTNGAQVGSTQLKAGDYKAVWDSTGNDVQVQILKGKNVVATVPAKLVDGSSGPDSVTLEGANRSLQQIHFGGLHQSLVFSADTPSGEGAPAAQE